jgi:hypothetical protein
VRDDGFIGGDDHRWGRQLGYPVKRAVEEFCRRQGIRVVALKSGNFVRQGA